MRATWRFPRLIAAALAVSVLWFVAGLSHSNAGCKPETRSPVHAGGAQAVAPYSSLDGWQIAGEGEDSPELDANPADLHSDRPTSRPAFSCFSRGTLSPLTALEQCERLCRFRP